MPSMMKQKFKNTIRLKMIVPAIIFGLLGVVSVATAQKATTPPKKAPSDIMLNKRNANEVIQRALADWGTEMLNADATTPNYSKLVARYTFLNTVNEMLVLKDKTNVSGCIEEAGKLIWVEKVITDAAIYQSSIEEIKGLLLKLNNPNYKE
jgi:hypothetical protein